MQRDGELDAGAQRIGQAVAEPGQHRQPDVERPAGRVRQAEEHRRQQHRQPAVDGPQVGAQAPRQQSLDDAAEGGFLGDAGQEQVGRQEQPGVVRPAQRRPAQAAGHRQQPGQRQRRRDRRPERDGRQAGCDCGREPDALGAAPLLRGQHRQHQHPGHALVEVEVAQRRRARVRGRHQVGRVQEARQQMQRQRQADDQHQRHQHRLAPGPVARGDRHPGQGRHRGHRHERGDRQLAVDLSGGDRHDQQRQPGPRRPHRQQGGEDRQAQEQVAERHLGSSSDLGGRARGRFPPKFPPRKAHARAPKYP